ncbi:hypothetical protein Anapl_00687 [Anas platyrhynchos]|uniref:Uncharacterized protein n=1 Tax=Anas platyrhynchos TaxID=8839 RepID=R0LSH2_ANAPL|nr:hypothetical protein Anapl_00687 [Anas platyrhynchos]
MQEEEVQGGKANHDLRRALFCLCQTGEILLSSNDNQELTLQQICVPGSHCAKHDCLFSTLAAQQTWHKHLALTWGWKQRAGAQPWHPLQHSELPAENKPRVSYQRTEILIFCCGKYITCQFLRMLQVQAPMAPTGGRTASILHQSATEALNSIRSYFLSPGSEFHTSRREFGWCSLSWTEGARVCQCASHREELRAASAECQMPQPEKKLVTNSPDATHMGAGRAQQLCQLLNKPSSLPAPLPPPPTHRAHKGCIAASHTSFSALKVQAN